MIKKKTTPKKEVNRNIHPCKSPVKINKKTEALSDPADTPLPKKHPYQIRKKNKKNIHY